MKQEWKDWIAKNVQGTGYGDCAEVTEAMAKEFPELRRVRGFYWCHTWGERQHWWLVDPAGVVVDPTAAQFPSKGRGCYEEVKDEDLAKRVPIGVCANCGGPIYADSEITDTVCSKSCGDAYIAYLMNP